MNENTMNNDVTMAGEPERALLASRYRIIRQLGQGGMGSVWLAEDTQLDGKLFAIKMLPSILVANKRAYQQLKSEALVAMKLVHPNIVQIRAFEENNGNPFLVMDYIDGETLDDWLGDRGQELGGRSQGLGVSEEEVVRLLKPIAEALDYAHTEGVVHRDIKPANVMIRKDGRPFIMDFGIAREIQETLTRVTGKMSSGTLMYMSPEQLNGASPKPAQDVYSFAAMVYECLKGEPPFCRGNVEFQIMNKEPEPLICASRQEAGTISSSVIAGLAKKSEDRPECCVDVLNEKVNIFQSSGKKREGERPYEAHGGLFGKIAAISLLVFGLSGGVWYWEGIHENEAGSDLLPPTTPPAKTNVFINPPQPPQPPQPQIGPTEADIVDVVVEASVQKERIGRIDDEDGFKAYKERLSEILIKANTYKESKRWSSAAVNYTNYVEECKKLVFLDGKRGVAKENKEAAEGAQKRAMAADAVKYVAKQWNSILVKLESAKKEYSAMNFTEASRLYEKVAQQFAACETDAKKECARLKKEQEQREVALREKERLAAVAARSFALKESKRAEEEGAKQYAVDSWNRIVIDWKSADDLLKEKRYAEAKNKFDEIAKAYAECIETIGRAKQVAEEQRIENERLKEEKRKAMRRLPGKWECQTESTTMGASTKLNYIYEFQENGSYVNVMKHPYGGRVITTGTWSLTGTTLLLNDSGTTQSYTGNVGGKIYKHTHKREPTSGRYNLLWREDGTFELRYADSYWKNEANEVSVSYDSDGKCHQKCRVPGGFLRSETTYETVETAKVFRRVK